MMSLSFQKLEPLPCNLLNVETHLGLPCAKSSQFFEHDRFFCCMEKYLRRLFRVGFTEQCAIFIELPVTLDEKPVIGHDLTRPLQGKACNRYAAG